YQYVDSSIVWPEEGTRPDPNNRQYIPTTWPGARLPHMWLEDGSALHDRLSATSFSLLRLGGTSAWAKASGLESALRVLRVPVQLIDVPDGRVRGVFERDLILIRPDLHVAWRGNAEPIDPLAVAKRILGYESPAS